MANPPRARKRVRALRRAPDGSAFQNCEGCGVRVPVALIDLHECIEKKKEVKRFRRKSETQITKKQDNQNQPRSPYCFFMESYMKTFKDEDLIEIDRKACEMWMNMSKEEQQPYVLQAEKLDSDYLVSLLQEASEYKHADDDEADSSTVGKFDPRYEDDECSNYCNCYLNAWFWPEERDSLDTKEMDFVLGSASLQ